MASSLQDPRYRQLVDQLKAARLAAGLSQQELANRLGKPQSFVAKTEGYERRLDILEFLIIAQHMGLPPTCLSGLIDIP